MYFTDAKLKSGLEDCQEWSYVVADTQSVELLDNPQVKQEGPARKLKQQKPTPASEQKITTGVTYIYAWFLNESSLGCGFRLICHS